MTSGYKDVETLVSANSPFQDSFHLDDQIPPRLKPLDLNCTMWIFSFLCFISQIIHSALLELRAKENR